MYAVTAIHIRSAVRPLTFGATITRIVVTNIHRLLCVGCLEFGIAKPPSKAAPTAADAANRPLRLGEAGHVKRSNAIGNETNLAYKHVSGMYNENVGRTVEAPVSGGSY